MKRILILDDETPVRESFTDYFEDQLWEVLQAESGEIALEILGRESVDAAIVDVRLPGMDGNNFIREALKITQKTAFVICTGSPEYVVPNDFIGVVCVSNTLMIKPVSSFADLKKEILTTIQAIVI